VGLKKLTLYVVFVELIALGVFFAFFLGATASVGGVVTIDMTQYGEMFAEYWLMVILVAVTPYGLYVIDNSVFDESE